MVISRLLRATMVAGDLAPSKGPQPTPTSGSARGDASTNAATAQAPSDTLSQERR
jgi:hypothetical protein